MHPVERYLAELRTVRTAGGVPETSGYPALKSLLDEVGSKLKPKVVCLVHPGNTGAGIPDMALFGAAQVVRKTKEPKSGHLPEGGVVEVKATSANLSQALASEQVLGYVQRYGQALLTNYRQFVLLVRDRDGGMRKVDEFALAADELGFWEAAAHPRGFAERQGGRVVEFLARALRNRALLAEPKDVAWFLASYARDALDRLEHRAEPPALHTIREAFEQALGLTFTGEQGDHFFRSSLVQTLFYGVFSGWVLWSQERSPTDRESRFDWKDAAWTLRVPMIRALFSQVAQPGQLRALGLVEVLDRAGDVLNRVDRAQFFQKFRTDEAVQYFYEPFLEAFDPELRKELGVWYTPREIVQYQVARVDRVLRDELGVADGLADPQVVVLDPCCGTGAYLVEVLKTIRQTLEAKGGDALVASDLRQAARDRVFGFELLPAPFVVAHLQLGLLMQQLGAPFGDDGERAGIFLTNALTGWDDAGERARLPFPELEEERERADAVKQEAPILVILGNPPYNAFAGVAEAAEAGLVDVYKAGLREKWGIKKYNLDDLYVRFFRIAERKIVQGTRRGIVSYISNFSYLGDPSFVVFRQKLLEGFDRIWVDCLNGDSRETGKLTPEGAPDPSVFSTDSNREGIRVGTSICVMGKAQGSRGIASVAYRDFWGQDKRAALVESLSASHANPYIEVNPTPERRHSFKPGELRVAYAAWPAVTELAEIPPQNGLMEKRGGDLVAIDSTELGLRMQRYHDSRLDWDEYATLTDMLTHARSGFDPAVTRARVLAAGPFNVENLVRYALRPFDHRYCYYSAVSPLWNRSRPSYVPHVWQGNWAFLTRPARVAQPEGAVATAVSALGDNDFLRGHAYYIPTLLRITALSGEAGGFPVPSEGETRANVSESAREYVRSRCRTTLDGERAASELIWAHALAIVSASRYLAENEQELSEDWPRVPFPNLAETLEKSVALGLGLRTLLDPDYPWAPGEASDIGTLTASTGGALDPAQGDLAVAAGWGIRGRGGITMPAKGQVTEREDGNLDIWLNDRAYWANVPRAVWEYTLGGYQVVKKWLSYREKSLLGRDLTVEEVRYVTEMIRRIAAIIALGPALDENYERVKSDAFDWQTLRA